MSDDEQGIVAKAGRGGGCAWPVEDVELSVLAARLDGATLASMAVALRSFFIRTDSHLYRIGQPR